MKDLPETSVTLGGAQRPIPFGITASSMAAAGMAAAGLTASGMAVSGMAADSMAAASVAASGMGAPGMAASGMTGESLQNGTHLPRSGEEGRLVAVLDPRGVVSSCTQSLRDFLCEPGGVLHGRRIAEFVTEHVAGPDFEEALRRASFERQGTEGTFCLRSAGGTSVQFDFKVSAFRRPDGAAVIFLDVIPGAASPAEAARALESLAQFPEEDPNPVLRVSGEGTLLYANKASWVLLTHWHARVGRRVPEEWIQTVRAALGKHEVLERELQIGFQTILLAVVPIAEQGYVNFYGLDVSKRRRVEDKERLTAQVFENVTEGIAIMDADGRILDVNQSFCAITGHSREEVLGEPAVALDGDTRQVALLKDIWATARDQGSWQGEVWDRRKDGALYAQWLRLTAICGSSGEVTGYIGLFSDVTSRKDAAQRLFRAALYDGLTGLGNRLYCQDLLDRALKNARRTAEVLAVMTIDLDAFRLVNDDLGPPAGDALLCRLAARLKSSVRDSDTVARTGGDEFTVILQNVQSAENADAIARKVMSALTRPIELGGREVVVTASIGIAVFPQDAHETAALLRCADAALSSAREQGSNCCQSFSGEMSQWTQERPRVDAGAGARKAS